MRTNRAVSVPQASRRRPPGLTATSTAVACAATGPLVDCSPVGVDHAAVTVPWASIPTVGAVACVPASLRSVLVPSGRMIVSRRPDRASCHATATHPPGATAASASSTDRPTEIGSRNDPAGGRTATLSHGASREMRTAVPSGAVSADGSSGRGSAGTHASACAEVATDRKSARTRSERTGSLSVPATFASSGWCGPPGPRRAGVTRTRRLRSILSRTVAVRFATDSGENSSNLVLVAAVPSGALTRRARPGRPGRREPRCPRARGPRARRRSDRRARPARRAR